MLAKSCKHTNEFREGGGWCGGRYFLPSGIRHLAEQKGPPFTILGYPFFADGP